MSDSSDARKLSILCQGMPDPSRWEFEISVRAIDDAQIDFGGPFVHGKRGERALGLCWGTVAEDGAFNLFWAAKLRLSDVDPSVVWEAMTSGGSLVASLGLTDSKGWPRCASVRPPVISWSVEVR